MKPDKVLATLSFLPGNRIPYGQDFSQRRGIPHGIEFEVREPDWSDVLGTLTLTAPGYGKHGDYGCGRLYVTAGSMRNAVMAVCDTVEARTVKDAIDVVAGRK